MSIGTINKCAGLILAGGGGRRLGGRDKARIELGGVPLLTRAVEALQPMAAPIAIASGPNLEPSDIEGLANGLPILADIAPNAGPIGGIAAGLAWAKALGMQWLATAPVDAPFLEPEPYRRMAAMLDEQDAAVAATVAIVAESAGRTQWLVALISTDLAEAAAQAALRDDKSIARFVRRQNWRTAPMADLASMFDNINTPADLAAAELRAAASAP